MQKTYKLKLTPQTLKYLKKIKRKYKVKVSVGPIQDFDLEVFGIEPQPGYFIVSEGQTYIYVNNRQPYKSGHDLVVLHEIGHLLMNQYNFNKYQNQEEAFANGFALSMGTELGIKASLDMINEMCYYSHGYFARNKTSRKKLK
jgi:hypothetical protein